MVAGETGAAQEASGVSVPPGRVGALRGGLLVAVVATVVFLAGVPILFRQAPLSVYDELTHLDMVIQASEGNINPSPGAVYTQDAMREQACSGQAVFDIVVPACDSPSFDPADFLFSGISTGADGIPNPYYVVTGVALMPLRAMGVDLLDGARALSLAAHALGAGIVALLLAILGRGVWLSGALGLVGGLATLGLSQAVTVSPDSWSLLAGSLSLAVALSAPRMRPIAILLSFAGLGLMLALLKPNWVILCVIPWFTVIAIAAARPMEMMRDRRVQMATVATVVAGLMGPIVILLQSVASSGTNLEVTFGMHDISASNPFDLKFILQDVLNSMRLPQGDYYGIYVVPPLNTQWLVAISACWAVLFVGAAGLNALSARINGEAWPYATAAILIVAATPALVYLGAYATGSFFVYPQRYTIVVWPVLLAGFWPVGQRRQIFAVLGAFVTVAATFWVVARGL